MAEVPQDFGLGPKHNEFIYRRTAEIFAAAGPDPIVFDPESALARLIELRAETMQARGIDPVRLSVVTSKAQIDHSDSTHIRRGAHLEDIHDH